MTDQRERWEQIHDEIVHESMQGNGPNDRMAYSRIACKRIAELEASLTTLKDMREQWNANVERIRELEAERDALPDFAERARKAEWFIEKEGYRRCDNPACNCDSWHARDGWYARFQELKEVLDPGNGETLLDCAKRVVAEIEKLRAARDEWIVNGNREARREALLEAAEFVASRDNLDEIRKAAAGLRRMAEEQPAHQTQEQPK